jgi:dihydroxynaphthoic acid synthetase
VATRGAHDGQYDGRGTIGLPIEELQTLIRDVPKPVIARVQGFAIGGGNVLATLCDLTIASERAQFGQVGPKVGSVDPGFGTAYLARVVGEKKAREIWYMCRRYTAAEAERMGLVNCVVAHDELDAEVDRWCAEIMEKSPTAISIAKRSFNADSENIRGIGSLGMQALSALLRHRGIEGGRQGLPREAQTRFPPASHDVGQTSRPQVVRPVGGRTANAIISHRKMVPQEGFEPPTPSLRMRCSTS